LAQATSTFDCRSSIASTLRGLNVPKALAEAIDEVVETITTTIELAADKAIPKARLSERSKPWWSTELATLRKASSKASRHYYSHPSLKNQRKATRKRASYLKAIKVAKEDH